MRRLQVAQLRPDDLEAKGGLLQMARLLRDLDELGLRVVAGGVFRSWFQAARRLVTLLTKVSAVLLRLRLALASAVVFFFAWAAARVACAACCLSSTAT